MPTRSVGSSILLFALALAGCAGTASIRPLTDSNSPIQWNGFSLPPPQGAGWYIQEAADGVEFFKMLSPGPSRDPSIAEPQSFALGVLIQKADSREIATADGLRNYVDQHMIVPDPKRRQRLIDHKTASYTEQGTDCVHYEAKFEEQPRKFVLEITGAGFVCRHPSSPGYVVHGTYSERHARDSETQAFDTQIRDAEALLKKVTFTPMR